MRTVPCPSVANEAFNRIEPEASPAKRKIEIDWVDWPFESMRLAVIGPLIALIVAV
jgi:hypothetical protein